jgi:hypothetical protein
MATVLRSRYRPKVVPEQPVKMSDRFPSRRLRVPRLALVLLVAAAGFGPRLLAAEDSASAVEAEFQSRFAASSDLASGGGAVSQAYESIDLSLPVAGFGGGGLGVDLSAERLQFHFSNFGLFLAGRAPPLSGADLLTLQPNLVIAPNHQWSLIGSALVQYAGADHASTSAAGLWGASVGAVDQASPTLKVGLGVEVEERMKASALVLPYPIIDWHLSDRWVLTSLDGTTGRLAYACTEAWSVFGQLEFQEQDIRLRRTSSIPSGIVRYEAYPLSVGILWKPHPRLTASCWVGEALDQSYRFEDQNGRLLRASLSRSPGIATLDLDYSF